MKGLCLILAILITVPAYAESDQSALAAQLWKIDPPGEGSAATYVYTAPEGSFISNSPNSLWIIYGLNAPRPDGTCTFDSCGIGVSIDGRTHHGQAWVSFRFSDGSEEKIDHPEFEYVVSDRARVNWPVVRGLIAKMKQNSSVIVTYADGSSHRFSLSGSSEAIERGARIHARQ